MTDVYAEEDALRFQAPQSVLRGDIETKPDEPQRRPHAQPPKEHGTAPYALEKGNQVTAKNHENGEEEWTELKHCCMTKKA